MPFVTVLMTVFQYNNYRRCNLTRPNRSRACTEAFGTLFRTDKYIQ